MSNSPLPEKISPEGIISRLARDKSGNVIAMVAASLFPLIGLIGGGIDMGRGYLAQSRLQQACDAGVLGARKRLGSELAVTGVIPEQVAQTGERFFNINFRAGAYGSENRTFQMTLEGDYAISGSASVEVPTTLMAVFGYNEMPVTADCQAQLNFGDVDVMMVLDVTGSMRLTNPGDTATRIDSLRQVIRNFHTQIESAKAAETEIRYGFVPYNANVNVGGLLEDDWVVDNWTYQSRETAGEEVIQTRATSTLNRVTVSGSVGDWVEFDTYAPAAGTGDVTGDCTRPLPESTYTSDTEILSTVTEPFAGPPAGEQTTTRIRRTENGKRYFVRLVNGVCVVEEVLHDNFVEEYDSRTRPYEARYPLYNYRPISRDVSNWRTESSMCIEERSTYEITDYDNVDFSQALDLDIDLVPTAGNPDTQWRPQYPGQIWGRALKAIGGGEFNVDEVLATRDFYINPGFWWMSDCPPPAQKLQEMDLAALDTYLATLEPEGSTYHDIGMIWGGRLMSPTGLFAAENGDTGTKTRSRHMIWMTDGQTEPYDVSYGAYGLEPLDQRRWNPDTSTLTQTEVVEQRFGVACDQVKNRNITVWVIAFGTETTPIMEECAGSGRFFEAANADELNEAFSSIASSLGDLRVSR